MKKEAFGSRRTDRARPLARVASLAFLLCGFLAALPAFPQQKQAVIKLWDHHIHDKKFRKDIFKQFNAANPDIKVEYTSQVGGSLQTVLEAAFLSGTPPDIFVPLIPGGLQKAVEMGWLAPLDDLAPSKEELRAWMQRFPQNLYPFVEGSNMIQGKVYSWPNSLQDVSCMIFWNTKLFREAGLVGSAAGTAVPETLADVRQFAKKITALGQGKVYGIVHGIKTENWPYDIIQPATGDGWSMDGWPWQGFDFRKARFDYHNPGLLAHFQNWLDMKSDGSIFPGDLSMDEEQAKFKFAQDLAGMIYGGWWIPGGMLALNADLEFDTTITPTVEKGKRKGGLPGGGTLAGNSEYVVSSKVSSREAAWKVIQFMTSREYQEAWVKAGGGFSAFPEYNRAELFPHPTLAKIAQFAKVGRRLGPIVSQNAARVWATMNPGLPLIDNVLTGIYIEKLGWDALDEITDRTNRAFEKAIEEVNQQGLKVSKEDFLFLDWNPAEDYIAKPRK